MIITKITQQAKNNSRASIFVDDKFYMGVNKFVVFRLGIKTGQKLTPVLIEQLNSENESNNIWEYSLWLLSKAPKSVYQMKQKLMQKFPDQEVGETIDRLVADGLLDDDRLAQQLAERHYREQLKSRIEATAHIIAKGIDGSIAKEACQILDSDYEQLTVVKLVEFKLRNKQISKDNITKTSQYLARKGFSYMAIKLVVADLGRDVE
ncbi:MAG: regulatory protein RecX [Patescibacteria group bacterium]